MKKKTRSPEEKQKRRAYQKRKWTFLFALCTVAVILWIVGEIILGGVLDLGMTVSRIWAIGIIVATFAFSLWKCPRP